MLKINNHILHTENPKLQKKRGIQTQNMLYLRFGDCGIFFMQQGRIELVYLTFVKKILKKLKKKLKPERSFRKIWFFYTKNWSITKKTKNSRMGKGKGMFIRRCYRVSSGTPLLEFYGYNYIYIRVVKRYLQKKIPLQLTTMFKECDYNTLLSKYFLRVQTWKRLKTL